MLKKMGLLISLIVSQSLFAAQADIDKVVKLATTVKSVAATSDASDENLKLAAEKLHEVIDLLTEEGGGSSGSSTTSFEVCYEFAFKKYYASLSSAAAADKATVACKSGSDLDVLQFLYEKHYSSVNSEAAMDLAVAGSPRKLKGKLEIVKYMFEKYYSSMNSTTAATKASEGAQKVRKDGLSCLQKLYPTYYSSLNSAAAMDKAVLGCSSIK